MDKAQNRIFVGIIFFALLVMSITGCGQQGEIQADIGKKSVQDAVAPGSSQNEKINGKSEKEDYSNTNNMNTSDTYHTKLIFIKKSENHWLAVDERGIVHKIESSTVDPNIEPGFIFDDGLVTIASSGESQVKLKSSYSIGYVQQVGASTDEAPFAFAHLILDNCLYSSNPEYAVSEYTLKDVKVKKVYNTGRIDAVMTFDVKPSEGAYWWGPTQKDGYIHERQISFSIYGAEGIWQAGNYNISQYFPTGDNFPIQPQTQYIPTETQNIIYEDDRFSYFGDKSMLSSQSDETQASTTQEYMGTINRINRQTGAIEKLYQGDKNYSYKLFNKYANHIYILSDTWEPFSEAHPGYFGVLDTQTKKYKKLIDGAVIRAAIKEDKGYLFTDKQLVEVDFKTGNLRSICSLPFSPNYSYFRPQVNRIIDGKMYFGIFDADKTTQYVIDLNTGRINSIETLPGITNSEPSRISGTDDSGNSEQTTESSNGQFAFYPSGPDFIKTIINERGQVEITDAMRARFNLFARDYRWEYLPDMNYYESFFEANSYAQSFGYTNFGFAVFYVLQYMKNPEKLSEEAMQQAIQTLFVAKNGYKDMPHQAYRKLANYTEGYYSHWPEGGPDPNRMFYLLTGLEIIPDGSNGVDIKILAQSYYFNDTSVFESGEKEKWLAEKAEEMGVPELQAAAKLITSGKMVDLQPNDKFETTIYIVLNEQKQNNYNPKFISNRKSY